MLSLGIEWTIYCLHGTVPAFTQCWLGLGSVCGLLSLTDLIAEKFRIEVETGLIKVKKKFLKLMQKQIHRIHDESLPILEEAEDEAL